MRVIEAVEFFIDLPVPDDFDIPVNLYKYDLDGMVILEHQGCFDHHTLVGKTLEEVIALDPAFEDRWRKVTEEGRSTTWFTWDEPLAGKEVGPLIRGLVPINHPIPTGYLEFVLPVSRENEAFLKKVQKA